MSRSILYYARKPLDQNGWHQRWLSYKSATLLLSGGLSYDPVNNPDGFHVMNVASSQCVVKEYVTRRNQEKKVRLKWRTSDEESPRYSLGWIPFKEECLSISMKNDQGDFVRLAGKGVKQEKIAFDTFSETGSSSGPGKKKLREKRAALGSSKVQRPELTLKVLGKHHRVFNEKLLAYYLADLHAVVKSGNFSEDRVGDWYLNLAVEVEDCVYRNQHLMENLGWSEVAPREVLGLDPGVAHLATTSTGEVIESPGFYRAGETALAQAQREKQTQIQRRLSRRITRQRADFLQKASHRLAKGNQSIKMGGLPLKKMVKNPHKNKVSRSAAVPPAATCFETPILTAKGIISLAQRFTKERPQPASTVTSGFTPAFGKTLHDHGIGMFRRMLSDKCHWAGRMYSEVDEAYTTQVCPKCDHFTGPQGKEELNIRQWTCGHCHTLHDRDEASAQNIERILEGQTLLSSVPRCRELFQGWKHERRSEPKSSGFETRQPPRVQASHLALPEHGSGVVG